MSVISFLISNTNTRCDCSLELSRCDGPNEGSHHMI